MRTVALITDFAADNFAVGVMKSAVLAACPDARLIDITHAIPPFDVAAAGYLLSLTFPWFPPDTVYLAVVDPGVGSARRALALECGERVVIAPDNGLCAEALDRHGAGRTVAIQEKSIAALRSFPAVGATFHGRDVFGPAAGHVAAGNDITTLGALADPPSRITGLPVVTTEPGFVRGTGRFLDRFGNILTDIRREHLEAAFGDAGELVAAVNGRALGAIRDHYAAAAKGGLIALVNSWDVVEIAVVGGNAAQELGIAAATDITVELTGRANRA